MSGSTHNDTHLVLDSLYDLAGSSEVLASMLGTIASTLEDDIGQLKQLAATEQLPQVASKLHTLKGYIPMMCQPAMAERLLAVEALLHPTPSSTVLISAEWAELVQDLDALHHEIVTALAQQG